MSESRFPIGGDWPAAPPELAWVFKIGETAGKALNVRYVAAATYTGKIDMPALLAINPGGKSNFRKAPNSNPTPTALSLRVDQDLYLGFILARSMDVIFADAPFSGGSAEASSAYFAMTRVDDRRAYMMVRGSQFPRGGCCYPFNIHLVATGTFADGVSYVTPIILDPDTRIPDGGEP
jgi:hypothetical protein